jgi:hypothetical protein
LNNHNACIVMLEIRQGNKVRHHSFSSAAQLLEYLRECAPTTVAETPPAEKSSSGVRAETPPTSCIHIMEDLASEYNKVLGSHFHINPKFFMQQEQTTIFGLLYQKS